MKLRINAEYNGQRILGQEIFADVKPPQTIERGWKVGNMLHPSTRSETFENSDDFQHFCQTLVGIIAEKCREVTMFQVHTKYEQFKERLVLNARAGEISVEVFAVNYPLYDDDGNITQKTGGKRLYMGYINASHFIVPEGFNFDIRGLQQMFNNLVDNDSINHLLDGKTLLSNGANLFAY